MLMMSFLAMRMSKRIYLGTVVLWGGAVVCHAFTYVNSILSGPPGPDLYANTVAFQIFVFVAGYFPGWLLVLFAMLLGEFAIMSCKPDNTAKKSVEKTEGK
jgi:hypothetical protein